jgi:hypothetical protein
VHGLNGDLQGGHLLEGDRDRRGFELCKALLAHLLVDLEEVCFKELQCVDPTPLARAIKELQAEPARVEGGGARCGTTRCCCCWGMPAVDLTLTREDTRGFGVVLLDGAVANVADPHVFGL